ncbi:hypothetical protein Tco_1001993 [Tanacetum coccineum]|uniref:Uncharacterized protein n=1 Tax=Tanacetum coccineum TaxID=301880 RepID=A0ABQ5F5G1_9ASTR
MPGLEEPEQTPPLPDFVPEHVYPEFIPPEDNVLPAEEYIADSDPEEDEEDHKEDPTDYPADGGDDDDDDDESSDDEEDDDDDVEEDEDEEEEFLAISTPPPLPLTSYSSPLPQIPSPPLPVSLLLPVSPPLLPASPSHPLGYRAAMIRLRAESPSTSHPLPLLLIPF